MTWTTDNQ